MTEVAALEVQEQIKNIQQQVVDKYMTPYYCIGSRGSGKTCSLIRMAKYCNVSIIVMSCPQYGEQKAKEMGIEGIKFVSYHSFFDDVELQREKFFIDEIDDYLQTIYRGFSGYSNSIGGV